MDKDKKILLYRIDEQAKNVVFVATEDNEKAWGNITEDNQTVLSFDDVFRDITEFRNNFLDYEQLTDELIGAINGRGTVFCEILERFDDNRLNSFNFFTRYYSDMLHDVFISAREDIDKAGALFNTRALKKSTEYVQNIFNHIRDVMRDDWNFDLYQIFAYVRNMDTENTGNISGLLLYARTEEEVFPNGKPFIIGGNSIGAQTLDLNQEFSEIAKQLDEIAYGYFSETE